MRTFDQLRKHGDLHRHATVIELGWRDILRLLLGREIVVWCFAELVAVRASPAYEAFNTGAAPPDAEKAEA